MNVTILKFRHDGRVKNPEVMGVYLDAKNAKKFIDKNKNEEKFKGGEWFLSDREVLDS